MGYMILKTQSFAEVIASKLKRRKEKPATFYPQNHLQEKLTAKEEKGDTTGLKRRRLPKKDLKNQVKMNPDQEKTGNIALCKTESST